MALGYFCLARQVEAADRPTEKKAAAADDSDRYPLSPVPLVDPNRPKSAPSCADMQRIQWWPDWVAVDAVSCEPVSGSNSLLTGKRTGNFANSRPIEGKGAANSAASTGLYEQIPYAIEQGIFSAEQGNFLRDQGILIRGAGTLVTVHFSHVFSRERRNHSRSRS